MRLNLDQTTARQRGQESGVREHDLQGSPRNLGVLTGKAFGAGSLSLRNGIDDLQMLIAGDDEDLHQFWKFRLQRDQRVARSQRYRKQTIQDTLQSLILCESK